MNNQPKFVCIGAQRAGSTWLYENLKAHDGIWLPPIKELHYFDQLRSEPFFSSRYKSQLCTRINQTKSLLRRGRWSLADSIWDVKFFCTPRSDRWYASLFSQGRHLAAGDFTPAYATLSAGVIADIKRINPDMKVIFLMRDPIDREWSQARKDLPRVHGKLLDNKWTCRRRTSTSSRGYTSPGWRGWRKCFLRIRRNGASGVSGY